MLVIGLLTQAFYARQNKPAGNIGPYSRNQLRYGRFEVMDRSLAERLHNWQSRHDKAHTAINEFMNETFPRQFCWGRTLYRIGDDGHVNDVLYNGYIPKGWSGGGEKEDRYFHTIAPDDPQIIQEIARLPRVPSYRELAETIDWPYFENKATNELRHAIIESINRSPYIETPEGRIILHLPYADNFSAHEKIATTLQEWEPPSGLQPLPDKKRRLLENRL
ncbi:MAG: hypothetical protein NDJ24_09915 [Alphaproteobacteria bacterium]|nr:hypothetical protein [Alphaproteobacteria bacterium]